MSAHKILVVDDEEGIRHFLLKKFSASGYEVVLAKNAAEARKLVRENLPSLIVMDIMLPDTDGGEVILGFQANPVLARIPVIFLSSIVNEEDGKSGSLLKIGTRSYEAIGKPVHIDVLLKKIAELIAVGTT